MVVPLSNTPWSEFHSLKNSHCFTHDILVIPLFHTCKECKISKMIKYLNLSRGDFTLPTKTLLCCKGLSSQSYGFSSCHVWMWELDHEESWVLKNWCFWTVVLEKTLESPLDVKEIKPVNPKGNQLWIFIGRTDTEVEAPILWPPDAKNWLIGKDPGAEKDWKQDGNGATEDEMVGRHHRLNGHAFE